MITLKQAIIDDTLDKFVEQHTDAKGDKTAFDAVISSMAGKSKPVQKTSYRDDHDD